jgi:hypothetical protein
LIPRIPPGKAARYVALVFQAALRLKAHRCPTCGERPKPFNLLFCERCQQRIETEIESRRK